MAASHEVTMEEVWEWFSTGVDTAARSRAAYVLCKSRDWGMHARMASVVCDELAQLALPVSIDDPTMHSWMFLVHLLERLVLRDPDIRKRVMDLLIQRAQEICVIEWPQIDGLVFSALRKYASLAAHSGLSRLEPFLAPRNGRYRLVVFNCTKNVLEVRPLYPNESAGGLLDAARTTASMSPSHGDTYFSPEDIALISAAYVAFLLLDGDADRSITNLRVWKHLPAAQGLIEESLRRAIDCWKMPQNSDLAKNKAVNLEKLLEDLEVKSR